MEMSVMEILAEMYVRALADSQRSALCRIFLKHLANNLLDTVTVPRPARLTSESSQADPMISKEGDLLVP